MDVSDLHGPAREVEARRWCAGYANSWSRSEDRDDGRERRSSAEPTISLIYGGMLIDIPEPSASRCEELQRPALGFRA
jgi:hypothetical protein